MLYIFILLVLGIGYLFYELFYKEVNLIEKLSYGYGLGIGLFSVVIFFLGIAGFRYEARNIFLLALVLFVSFLLLRLYSQRNFKKKSHLFESIRVFHEAFLKTNLRSFLKLKNLLLLYLLFLTGWILLVSSYWPVNSWDAITLYDYRAKVIADKKNLQVAEKIFWSGKDTYMFTYPYQISIINSYAYIFDYGNPHIFYILFFLSFAGIMFSAFRKKMSRNLSLLGVLIIITFPFFFERITDVFPNAIYLYYLMGACFLSERYFIEKKTTDLLFISLLLGLAVLIRDKEPFYLAIMIPLFVLCLARKKLRYFIGNIFIFLIFPGSWLAYKNSLIKEKAIVVNAHPLVFDGHKINEVIVYLVNTLSSTYGVIILFLLITIVANFRKLVRNSYYGIMFALFLILFIGGVYYLSYMYDFWNDIPDSLIRTALFIVPMSIYLGFSIAFDERK